MTPYVLEMTVVDKYRIRMRVRRDYKQKERAARDPDGIFPPCTGSMHLPRDNCLLPLRGISCPLGPWGQAITAPTMLSVESFKAYGPVVVKRQSSDILLNSKYYDRFLQNLDQFQEVLY